MKTSILIPTASLVIGLTGGYFAGKRGVEDLAIPQEVSSSKSELIRSKSPLKPSADKAIQVYKTSEAILNSPGQTARIGRLMSFYENLDPALFSDEAKKVENLPWSERIIASYLLFSRWGEEAPREALAYTDTMGGGGRFVKPTVLQSWAGKDPENAAQYYVENASEFANRGWGGRRGGAGSPAEGIAKEWARADPAAALAWSKGLTGDDASRSVSGVFQQVASDDPAGAAEMLAKEGKVDGRAEALSAIAESWGKTDPKSAELWTQSLSGDEQAGAIQSMIKGLATVDVDSAAEKSLAISDGDIRDDSITEVANQMSRDRPEEALNWLMENGSEQAKRDGVGEVMSSLARQNDGAAQDFISQQETGPIKDSAAAYYVFSNRNSDGLAVVNIALTIADETRRRRSLRRATNQWLKTDPEAAKEFIESTDHLSDRNKERLLN